jgi:hypothetical protein
MQPGVDRVEVVLANVLGRVHPEAGDSVADQLVQVGRQRVLYRVGLGPKILQADEVALEHLQFIVEVLDPSVAGGAYCLRARQHLRVYVRLIQQYGSIHGAAARDHERCAA